MEDKMALFLVTATQSIGKIEKGMNVEVVADHPSSIFSNRCGEILIEAIKKKYNVQLYPSDIDSTRFETKKL